MTVSVCFWFSRLRDSALLGQEYGMSPQSRFQGPAGNKSFQLKRMEIHRAGALESEV